MPLKVFIVNQGRLAADDVAALLRFMGHQVHAAPSTESLLDEALAFRPDLALIDCTMPAAVRACQGLALSGTRIVAVGSAVDAQHFQDGAGTQVYRVLSTPCDRAELSQVLASAEDDVFDCREDKEGYKQLLRLGALEQKHQEYLAQVTVFRLEGGSRDGQELFGDRAARLYADLDELPLHRTFLACRRRLVHRRWRSTGNCRFLEIIERHPYLVESVTRLPDQILITARAVAPYE